MNSQVNVVYAPDPAPDRWDASVFLAGPSPRSPHVPSWRPEAVELLRKHWSGPGTLAVFVPEPPTGSVWTTDAEPQRRWELDNLAVADQVLFWIPRDLDTLPGLTTNDEWGWLKDSGRAVLGTPPDAPRVRYQRAYAKDRGVPLTDSLEETVRTALSLIGPGADRVGPEREVPLNVWSTPVFQHWYRQQCGAGNRLLGARIVWAYGDTWCWALRVSVSIAAEAGRIKANEFVFARPDASAVLLYRRGETIDKTRIVLVREFRSASCTDDGYVRELPGGSDAQRREPDAAQAADEVREETGFAVDAARLRPHGARQSLGTLSAHRTHLFAAELTEEEFGELQADEGPYGAGASERTFVETITYGELLRSGTGDWSTLGMIAQVLSTQGEVTPQPGGAAG